MQIELAIFSCNSIPMYSDFWEPISKFWKTRFGIHPVLLYCDDNQIPLSDRYGDVHRFPSVKGVPDYMSATWGRFWLTKMYPDKTCIIGDIDLIPISPEFFDPRLKDIADDVYVHINSDANSHGDFDYWKRPYNVLCATGNIAKGSTFLKVYSFEDSFEDEMRKFAEIDYSDKSRDSVTMYSYLHEPHLRHASVDMGGKWSQDEIYSTDMLRRYLSRGGKVDCSVTWRKNARIDRSNWHYSALDVLSGKYLDSHLLRPYAKYKREIDHLMGLVPVHVGRSAQNGDSIT
jgi:hypothetical protein